MNEKFHTLPEEKQLAIFNAAMEVFAKNEYKKASTDLIAAKAEVSKGLLFYYFHNKKSLYLATYDFVMRTAMTAINDPHLLEISDFFELLTYATTKKLQLMEKVPFLFDFSVRAFYSEKEDVSASLKTKLENDVTNIYHMYFSHIDRYKFVDHVDPQQILNMLLWMSDGYLHDQHNKGNPFNLEAMMDEFNEWIRLLKKIAYKEAYQ